MNAKLLDREELVFSILDFMTIELPANLNWVPENFGGIGSIFTGYVGSRKLDAGYVLVADVSDDETEPNTPLSSKL
ncbi:MAG TPA: hypothetical protein EYQ26_03375 [Rhodospirillales bacterium]|nr:hypothetical protein [Rhodospirillales bacterium]